MGTVNFSNLLQVTITDTKTKCQVFSMLTVEWLHVNSVVFLTLLFIKYEVKDVELNPLYNSFAPHFLEVTTEQQKASKRRGNYLLGMN